jgi:hypothetical protein
MCDKHGIGGDGKYCGDNDTRAAQPHERFTTRPLVESTYHARNSSIPA